MNERNSKGNRHGFWELHYNDGNIRMIGNYNNGIPIGYWKTYYCDGSLYEEKYYL